MLPLLFFIGFFITNLPWHFLAVVPFWGSERVKKSTVIYALSGLAVMRAAVGSALIISFENGNTLDDYYYLLHCVILFAVFFICYKIPIVKMIYVMLLNMMLATTVAFLAHLVSAPLLLWGVDGFLIAEPAYIIAAALAIGIPFPFLYRIFKVHIRQALTELSTKTILSLCAAPAMFYIVGNIYVITLGAFSNALISFIIVFSGLFSAYINLRMVLDAAKASKAEREATALEVINKLRTDLMATISHETRTPLAVISSYTELIAMELRAQGVNEQHAKDLEKVSREIHHIGRLMEEMQGLSRLRNEDTGKSVVNLVDLINQTAGLYRHILERRDTSLTVELPDALPPVYINPGELSQVLYNLLQNARNHTWGGGVTIRAGTVNDRSHIKITVADTGEGIAPDLLPSVFERGVTGREVGTGLGLAVCKEIVASYGGGIAIESVFGKGTAVRFTLPVHKGI